MEPTDIGKHHLKLPIYNASGVHCVELNELTELKKCHYTGAVLTKSSTICSRKGNCLPRYYFDSSGSYSINSSGLPNIGMNKYIDWINDNSHTKPCILSIAPLTLDDLRSQITIILDNTLIVDPEINLSCPNIAGKPQVAYDVPSFEEYNRVIAEILGEKGYGLKVPPYFDNVISNDVIDIINSIETNSYVTCINSVPNTFAFDDTFNHAIAPNQGYGGMGGACILPIALSNVRRFSLSTKKDIVGCGGITCGSDIKKHFSCGAKAVQIGTSLYENGINDFERLYTEFCNLS